jgi:hypothetical protein
MNILDNLRNFFSISTHRIILTIIAFSVYHNTYSDSNNENYETYFDNIFKGGVLFPIIFPSFYISYMYVYYPENFNYNNKNPTIPKTGLVNEFNILINSPWKTLILFIILYLFFTFILYKKQFKKIITILK